jgi:hypothetical protein
MLQHTPSTMRVAGQVMVMRTLSMSQEPIDPKMFELPPAVRALLARTP